MWLDRLSKEVEAIVSDFQVRIPGCMPLRNIFVHRVVPARRDAASKISRVFPRPPAPHVFVYSCIKLSSPSRYIRPWSALEAMSCTGCRISKLVPSCVGEICLKSDSRQAWYSVRRAQARLPAEKLLKGPFSPYEVCNKDFRTRPGCKNIYPWPEKGHLRLELFQMTGITRERKYTLCDVYHVRQEICRLFPNYSCCRIYCKIEWLEMIIYFLI